MPIEFSVNGKPVSVADAEGDMPLLWYLRESAGLRGTKFGCGVGQCGACTVHFNGAATRSCVLPLAALEGATITTIEGLSSGDRLHRVQQAWLDLDVAQCGYCQAGQIMAAAALLATTANPSDEQVEQHMTNLCRCGTYVRIREAIKVASRSATANQVTGDAES